MTSIEVFLRWSEASPKGLLLAVLGMLGLIVAVHELGHALMGTWCGHPPVRYQLGWGPSVRVGRLFGCTLALGLWPVGGRVTYVRGDVSPWRRAAMAAGGALATGGLGLLTVGLLHGTWSPELRAWLGLLLIGSLMDSAFSISPLSSDGRMVLRQVALALAQRRATRTGT